MKIFILLLTLISQNLAGNSPLGLHSADLANFGEQQTTSLVVSPKFAKNHESQTENPSVVDSARYAQNLINLKSCEAPENSPASWCKKSESKGAVVPPADFLLEAEKRGSPPKSEKRQLLARRGSGAGGAALLRKEKDSNENAESIANSVDSAILSQSGLPRSHSLAHNDEFNGLPREQSSLAMTENKYFAESPQNTQISKSPQDEFALDSALPKQKANSSIVDEKSGLRSHERGNRTNGSLTKRVASLPDLSPQDEFALDSANCKNSDITGFWLSPRDKVSARTSIIKIFKKDGKYFAYNVAFLDELPPKKDALNQNFALRDREILGSVYAYNLERSGEASYINGRYYDFNKGKIFHLKAKLDCNKLILLISADNVGFLGKKKVYSAITKSEAEFYIKEHPTIDFSGVK